MHIVPDNLAESPISFVVSLLPVRDTDQGSVLFGIRRETPTSSRHPNVLSTITMRIPPAAMAGALESIGVPHADITYGQITNVDHPRQFPIGQPDTMAHEVSYLAEALLSRKVALAEALVAGAFSGSVVAGAVAFDTVHDEESDPSAELTLMLSLIVRIHSGAEEIPVSTGSYRRLAWVPVDRVANAVARHDAVALVPDADPFEVCLHGLCVRSAARMAESGWLAGQR